MSARTFAPFARNATSSSLRARFARSAPRQFRSGARFQSTDAAPQQSRLQQIWRSPVGPKTVHFWAPIMKWGLVIAGISDFARPAESLSLTQNIALTCTGAIWTRWCFIIKPRNVLLAAVNFFLGCVGATQVGRILLYQRSVKDSSIATEAERAAGDVKDSVKGVVDDTKTAVKNAAN